MQLSVKNLQGETVDTVEVSDALLGVPLNPSVVHQAMVMYRLNSRQGTHGTKTRSQVSGGGRKPWIQKGTGRARQGSIRSPQWRHGGVVFGPHPRSYRRDMPRRMRHLALRCVLSEKARQGKLTLVDHISLPQPKTREMVRVLGNLLDSGRSALIVTRETDHSVVKAASNLKGVWTLPVALLNAAELLKRDALIMTVDAVRRAEELWAGVQAGEKTGAR